MAYNKLALPFAFEGNGNAEAVSDESAVSILQVQVIIATVGSHLLHRRQRQQPKKQRDHPDPTIQHETGECSRDNYNPHDPNQRATPIACAHDSRKSNCRGYGNARPAKGKFLDDENTA